MNPGDTTTGPPQGTRDGDTSLADLPGPQAPAVVAAIGLAVLEAIDSRPDDALEGLVDTDVRLDADGRPVLVPGPHLPESSRAPGGATGPAAARWGLGRILFRLATGREPVENPGRPGLPRARSLRPDLPMALDQAIATLLDPSPAARAGAIADLHDVAGPLPDLHLLAERRGAGSSAPRPTPTRTSRVGEVQVTTAADTRPSARLDIPPLRTALIVPAERANALTPSERSAAAGVLGIPDRALRDLVAAGLPVPLAVDLRGSQADDAARDLPLATESVRAAGTVPAVGAAGAGLVGLAGLAATLVLAVPILLSGAGAAFLALPAALGLVSGLFLVLAVVLGLTWTRQRSGWRGVEEAHRRILEARRVLGRDPLADRLRERLARARREIAKADLPDLAERDLRDALDGLESSFDGPLEPERVDALVAELDTLTADLAEDGDPADGDASGRVNAGLERLRRTRALLAPADDADDPRRRATRAASRSREPQ